MLLQMAESDGRHITASAAERRAEAVALKLELKGEAAALKNDMLELNQRSPCMEAQLQELISRAAAS